MARICENGTYRDMTAEELENEFVATPEISPTDADRISALESAVTDLAMMLVGVINND